MLDVLIVFGTRPELNKLAPVVAACRARGLSAAVAATGQHSDLLDADTLERLGPVVHLGVPNDGVPLRFTHDAQRAVLGHIGAVAPRCVLVQGDTASAHAGALAGHAAGIPVAHVEAGLRSGDLNDPWPEEGIRVAISSLATWHYAPTTTAAMRLGYELRTKRNVSVEITGNTSVDALCALGVKAQPTETGPAILVTLHRRELREGSGFRDTMKALAQAAASTPGVTALWPIHPAMLKPLDGIVFPANFILGNPLPHAMLVNTLVGVRGVLTDSGGLVEEAATLGVPTAVLRHVTDRPEAEEAGIATRLPPTPKGVASAWQILANCDIARIPTDVYGDGTTGVRIARHLAKVLGA